MFTPIAKNKSDKRTTTHNPSIIKFHDQVTDMVEKRLELASRMPTYHNTPVAERNALRNLSENYDIVIREADKGSAVVLMDKHTHLRNANEMLKTSTTDAIKHLKNFEEVL